ncbi:hypothetical protein HRH25_12735 [Flavisolibacter sp. BT320]|nr:hypothetical protein [Flavisolibacter longurius]
MAHLTSLNEIFECLQDADTYRDWTKTRIIKITLGNSVIRVFVKTTKTALIGCLSNLPVEEVTTIMSQAEYDEWHFEQVQIIYDCLRRKRGNVGRLGHTGLLYGHATKIFNIFIGHLIFYSPYFRSTEVREVKKFLHVPLDKKVFDALKACSIPNVPPSIKNVTEVSYYDLQEEIRIVARRYRLPALYFDEYAWAFDKNE